MKEKKKLKNPKINKINITLLPKEKENTVEEFNFTSRVAANPRAKN